MCRAKRQTIHEHITGTIGAATLITVYACCLCCVEQCGVVPLTVAQVQIESRRDERAGFFVHPVLDVSWCPTPCEWCVCVCVCVHTRVMFL